MTTYHPHGVKLLPGQKEKLSKAFNSNSAVTIRLTNDELSGNDQLMLTKRQINKLIKAKNKKKGSEIKISKTQIRKAKVHGGSLWSSLFSLGAKAVPALATGALSALGSMGINKLFGRRKQKGSFLIPQDKINQLINYKNMLTKKQKEDIINALQSGGQLIINPTKTQTAKGLGTILTSLGIPLAIEAIKKLTGRGLHVEHSRPRRSLPVHVPDSIAMNKSGGKHWQSPPVVGTWDNPIGFGMKKKKKGSSKAKIPILGTIL